MDTGVDNGRVPHASAAVTKTDPSQRCFSPSSTDGPSGAAGRQREEGTPSPQGAAAIAPSPSQTMAAQTITSPQKPEPTIAQLPASAAASGHKPGAQQVGAVLPGAWYALSVLTLLNLFNFCDRFVPSACKGLIQTDLHLSDVQTALPMGAFLIIYMITSPIFGYLADQQHVRRTVLIGAGVFLWSCATVAGAFAHTFTHFLLARAFVGVGEASFATIAPALLCDFFPVAMRPKILSYFYLAIPVGAALGYTVAGAVSSEFGWRASFLVCGVPGMILVLLVLGIAEPQRGIQDAAVAIHASDASILLEEEEETIGWPEALKALFSNSHYKSALLAVTLVSFGSGGIADWLPMWLTRVVGITTGQAGVLVGATTCLAGVSGSLSGYVIGEWLTSKGLPNAYFLIGAGSQVATCFFSALILLVGRWATIPELGFLLFACQLNLWLNMGGCSAIIANSVHPKIRSRAFGLSILISHLGGDAISPSLIGIISDRNNGNLTAAFSVVPVAFGLAALVFAAAWYRLKRHDSQQALTAGSSLPFDEIELQLS